MQPALPPGTYQFSGRVRLENDFGRSRHRQASYLAAHHLEPLADHSAGVGVFADGVRHFGSGNHQQQRVVAD